jgi:glycosyltransferase involved in cell wall biosynthesis
VTCNEALVDVLGEYKDELMFKKGDASDLAKKIIELKNFTEQQKNRITTGLRDIVVSKHNVKEFIARIVQVLK